MDIQLVYFEKSDGVVLDTELRSRKELEEEYLETVAELFQCSIEGDITGLPTDRLLTQG